MNIYKFIFLSWVATLVGCSKPGLADFDKVKWSADSGVELPVGSVVIWAEVNSRTRAQYWAFESSVPFLQPNRASGFRVSTPVFPDNSVELYERLTSREIHGPENVLNWNWSVDDVAFEATKIKAKDGEYLLVRRYVE